MSTGIQDNSEKGIPFPEKSGERVDLDESRNENVDTDTDADTDTDDEPADKPEEKLITQKELDRILKNRLRRQEEQFKKQYADYDQLKADAEAFRKLQDEKATDAERWDRERNALISERDQYKSELTKLQRANLIAELATDKGLPKSFWKRVQGETEEEIAEDIESIVNDLGLNKDRGNSKESTPNARKKGAVYGGGGERQDPEPDVDAIVAAIPRGPQFRTEKPRIFN